MDPMTEPVSASSSMLSAFGVKAECSFDTLETAYQFHASDTNTSPRLMRPHRPRQSPFVFVSPFVSASQFLGRSRRGVAIRAEKLGRGQKRRRGRNGYT